MEISFDSAIREENVDVALFPCPRCENAFYSGKNSSAKFQISKFEIAEGVQFRSRAPKLGQPGSGASTYWCCWNAWCYCSDDTTPINKARTARTCSRSGSSRPAAESLLNHTDNRQAHYNNNKKSRKPNGSPEVRKREDICTVLKRIVRNQSTSQR